MEEGTANKRIVTHAKASILSTIKKARLDIPKFHGKPPKIKGLTISPKLRRLVIATAQERNILSSEELGSPDKPDKETKEETEITPPREAIEELRTSDSETSFSSKASTSISFDNQAVHNNSSLWRGFSRLWKQKSLRRLSSFPPVGSSKRRWKNGSGDNLDDELNESALDCDSCFFKPSWKTFSIAELRKITNDFSEDNIIGKGGFAEVYEGCLEDGQYVAVKRLIRGTIEERTDNFLSELGILVHIDHPNIARLIGVGVEENLHLVLRLSPNGSLATLLHCRGPRERLEWSIRYKIALGTAEGLEYLHEKCPRRIIHCDMKAANVLLTEEFEPQICDFGLAKWLPDQLTHHKVSNFEGTFGYLAPEYLTHGVVDEKTDVFAYGVILLELISGRKALDTSQKSLVMWAKPLIQKNETDDLIDPSLRSYNSAELKHVIGAASMCIQQSSVLRPKISQVIGLLKGEEIQLNSPQMQLTPTRRRTYSEELFDAEEYNATKYLSDMNRHKQIALGLKSSGELGVSEW